MYKELEKKLTDLVNTSIYSKQDLAEAFATMLDAYTRKTGNGYITLLYPVNAFTFEGQFRKPEQVIPEAVAKSITSTAQRRTELMLEYRVMEEQNAMKNGFITCA